MKSTALLVASALALVGLAGCGSDKKSSAPSTPQRPPTDARIQIVAPTPNQETGADVTIQVKLIGAKEVPQVTGAVKPDEGHVHVSLDGTVVAMAYGDSQTLKGLTPGQHSVQVDFVAVDHLPFKNRVTAAVLFTVK
jgi:ABC-type phosphate/phosphonate transport system substrate-binding protein